MTSFYLLDKKENGTQGKDVLSNNNDDSTGIVVAIEGFANDNEEGAESDVDYFVEKEN